MDGTMISLFGDYKHGRRFKTEQSLRGGIRQENAVIMPTLLPRTLVRHEHRRGKSYPQVEMSRRLRCTATPPPSLESQSLPKISLRGNAARQQRHRGNHSSSKGKLGLAIGIPTIKCRATQSLPSLSNSNSSGKSTGKRTKKDPQRSSTFDLFQTSRQGRRMAAHSQNFSWDFSPRTEVPKTCMEIENNRLSKHGERKVETSRPVHLYMGVEMMDKLLEKRKGLRSDEMLNELIGLPPTKMRVSTGTCHAKKRPQRDDIQKHETVKDRESQDARQHPRDVDDHHNASNCKEVTTKESPGVETHVKTTPQKQPHDGDQCTCSNTMETKTGTASGKLVGEEDHPGNQMEGEFQDEEEEELGGIDDDEGSNVFDECEDDNEEDDGEEIEEDDAEEIGDDDVDSNDEGRGTSQDGDEEDGEQEEEFEDAEDLEDGEAQGDSEAEEVEEEEFEEVGNDDDDEEEEAERQDKDDNDYDAADDDELGEGQGGDGDDDDDDDDTDNDGDNENDDEEDGRTVGEGEREEELDELENNDDDEDDDMSDGDDDEQ